MARLKLKSFLILLVSALTIFVNGCDFIWPASANETQNPSKPRSLKVAILNHPFSWSSDRTGLERDLIERFAHDSGYQISWKVFKTQADALAAVKQKSVDIGAARFDLKLADGVNVLAGPAYEESAHTIICPKQKEESFYFLKKLFSIRFGKRIPAGFQVLTHKTVSSFDLLREVNLYRKDCASLENREAQFLLRMFPRLESLYETGPAISIGFLLSQDQLKLRSELFSWFQASSQNRSIEKTRALYFSHLNTLQSYDSHALFKTVKNQLNELEPKFKKVAKEFKLPWTLVAAVAYQESHWNNEAESFTGVKGLMMLTEETAEHLGVSDRTDLMQSLWGGAKYLRQLIDDLPQSLSARERLALALASYNVGPAHFDDAQNLAVHYGKDPWSWHDLKKVLPLLSRPDLFHLLQYGEARGEEPVLFANRVLNYYEIFRHMDSYKKSNRIKR